jgi:transcriptional regulator with XRE-family HTH domain
VSKPWPVEDFNQYLEALMAAKKIADRAELSRVAGIDQTQLSNWRHGKTSPSRQSLRKIAQALTVPPVNLYVAAGIDSPEDLDLSGAPDLTVLPTELRDLVDLYGSERLTEEDRTYLRRHVGLLVTGLLSDLAERPAPSTVKARRQRRSAA